MIDAWTYKEALDFAVDLIEPSATGNASSRRITQAILNAYRDISNRSSWRHYNRVCTLYLDAQYSTGTIEFDLATLTITLSGGTWPATADQWSIRIDEVDYPVLRRVSSTELLLSADAAPPASIASGKTYTLSHERYLLPDNFLAMQYVWDELTDRQIIPAPEMFQEAYNVQTYPSPGDPNSYSITSHENYPGRAFIRLHPIASTARTVRCSYRARPRKLIPRIITATGTLDADTDARLITVSSPTSTIDGDFLRSVVWVSSNDDAPTSFVGGYDLSSLADSYNPYSQSGLIVKVNTDGTEITVNEDMESFTSKPILITSMIDIDYHTMLTCFQAMIEVALAKQFSQFKNLNTLENRSHMEYRKAVEAEERLNKASQSQRPFMSYELDGDIEES